MCNIFEDLKQINVKFLGYCHIETLMSSEKRNFQF